MRRGSEEKRRCVEKEYQRRSWRRGDILQKDVEIDDKEEYCK